MAAGKWIGGVLGFITAGPLGALAGYALGSLFEHGLDAVNRDGDHHYNNAYDAYSGQQHNGRQGFGNQGYSRQQSYEGERNSFMFSLLVLSSYIINADGKIMHSEMEMVRRTYYFCTYLIILYYYFPKCKSTTNNGKDKIKSRKYY